MDTNTDERRARGTEILHGRVKTQKEKVCVRGGSPKDTKGSSKEHLNTLTHTEVGTAWSLTNTPSTHTKQTHTHTTRTAQEKPCSWS